jgi:hypothetical protein
MLAVLVLIATFPSWFLWQQIRSSMDRHALFEAIQTNDEVSVKSLLDKGADANLRDLPDRRAGGPMGGLFGPNQTGSEPTPLLAALTQTIYISPNQTGLRPNWKPNASIIRALLEKGADPNALNFTHTTPVTFAVASGNIEVVDLLIRHGAVLQTSDVQGPDLILVAASVGNTEMMRFLLTHGSDINARQTYSNDTALIHTVRYARMPDAVKFLIEHGVDINAKDRTGKTALFYAMNPARALSAGQTKHLPEVIALLKQAGAK